MPVRLLNDDTIGKIAAGETVERPVSVVKELLENALDAGAARIRIAIRDGGTGAIEVADDGGGILPDDLPLAVRRHATSKIAAFGDLDVLASLGFRGEALPSIGAVSDLTVRSRPPEVAHGTMVRVAFGVAGAPEPAAVAAGTVVVARDLFANVPARRKFLRQPGTETGYITRAVAAYAAAYPAVAIELLIDDRRAFATTGSGDPLAAALEALGTEIANAALPLEPLEASAAAPGVAVEGWVGAPSVTRSHRQGIALFVNGRWIQNRALGFALEEAYHSLLMVGRHPVAMAHLRLDPALVDVNVHPTKAEVKFADERAVCRALSRAAHAALSRAPHAELPEIRFDPPPVAEPAQRALPAAIIPPRQPPLTPDAEPDPDPTRAHPSGVPVLRVLGQVGSSFIIAEGPDGMYLIDQHAAHERVMYEKILAGMRNRAAGQQPLLDPLVLELTPDELTAYEKSTAELAEVGWDLERFAPGAVLIRAAPAAVRGVDLGERLRLVLHELAEGGTGESWLDAVAISTACHTAIRAGQTLSLAEMRELVAELERSQQPRACGHGRPTMLHMSRTDLEKQFQRR
ncbi:MAG: DNA mismatch repair endonuclease MutL [Thermomicrobiales bacterium]|nr:DNA mismatch repair endonuclease MutL [Thermomicrobiales bacterium]